MKYRIENPTTKKSDPTAVYKFMVILVPCRVNDLEKFDSTVKSPNAPVAESCFGG